MVRGVSLLLLAVMIMQPAPVQALPVIDPSLTGALALGASGRERGEPALAGPAGQRAERRADLSPTEASLPAEVIVRALTLMGIGYRWGGNLPETGMDCSGFVRHVFHEAAGLILPRRSEEMSRATVSVGREYLLPGDLVFFNTQRRGFSHVGIYLGDDKFVHAPAKGKPIRIDSMRERYWVGRYDGARRVMGELPSQDPAALDQVIERSLSRLGIPLMAEARDGLPAPREALSASPDGQPAIPLASRERAAVAGEGSTFTREVPGWRAAALRAQDQFEAVQRGEGMQRAATTQRAEATKSAQAMQRVSMPTRSASNARPWRAAAAAPRSAPAVAGKRKPQPTATTPKRPARRS